MRQYELRFVYARLELIELRVIQYGDTSLTSEPRSQNTKKETCWHHVCLVQISRRKNPPSKDTPRKLPELREGNESRLIARRLKQIRVQANHVLIKFEKP